MDGREHLYEAQYLAAERACEIADLRNDPEHNAEQEQRYERGRSLMLYLNEVFSPEVM